jgi:hypothetical protein
MAAAGILAYQNRKRIESSICRGVSASGTGVGNPVGMPLRPKVARPNLSPTTGVRIVQVCVVQRIKHIGTQDQP